MKIQIHGAPAFAHVEVALAPGEELLAESDAMASMDGDLDMKAQLNGGFLRGLARKYLGGESLFINRFTNAAATERKMVLSQPTPGDIRCQELKDESVCLQPGAYLCSTPGLKLGLRWAGFSSWLGREGLFKLQVSGSGTLCYGAYGGLVEREVDGDLIVDTSHLVAYSPSLKLKTQLAGGVFSSFFGGEGLVTRVQGRGTVVLQTRSLSGLQGWLNPKLS